MPAGTKTISKSELMSCIQCQKKLWLELYRPELADRQPGRENVLATGNAVGILARSLYDPTSDGTVVDASALGVASALRPTVDLLQERRPIFEATFSSNGAIAYSDVLLPVTSEGKMAWRIVEVKASTSVKDHHRDDAAVQAYLARVSGVQLASS